MHKLNANQINEYFDVHLPYRTRILLAHYKMRHTAEGAFVQWTGHQAWLDACFVASLITARLYLKLFSRQSRSHSWQVSRNIFA